jgi:hypothetical protein
MVNERSRNWKLGKQAASRCYSRTYKEIKKAKKQMQGLSAQKIQKILNCCKSFLGCFASDQLENLSLSFFPCTFIVNTDKDGMSGTHWICIRISKRKVEMFDSLGLIYENKLPIEILTFLQRFAVSRDIKFNKRLQPDSSVLCGFYCIFFIFLRQFCSFGQIQKYFVDDLNKNEKIISKFFK